MQQQWMCLALLALMIVTVTQADGDKTEKQGKKERKSDCGEWQWSVCVANEGDWRPGHQRGHTHRHRLYRTSNPALQNPCNSGTKQFGGECKYDFEAWGECDSITGMKTRTGMLKRALMDASCLNTVNITKPCSKPKTKIQGKTPQIHKPVLEYLLN
ncbi:hypothetical protein cypCar_00014764 [Cyprinus carpio]|nr:hypothetical protein cypCar_00014764 [Cyprinus carpio]